MDNPHTPVTRFVPDRRFTAGAIVGAVVGLVLGAASGSPEDRLIWGVAAVLLALYAASDLVFSPRLTVSAHGLVIRSPLTRATVVWDEVESVHADVRARHGLRSTTLEIDAGATLVVLSRRALGADPEAAAQVISAFRPV